MTESRKQWKDGTSLTATYEGSGDGSAVFTSDINEGIDREMDVTFVDESRAVQVTRTVKQIGLREVFTGYDEKFITADGGTFNSIKDGL